MNTKPLDGAVTEEEQFELLVLSILYDRLLH